MEVRDDGGVYHDRLELDAPDGLDGVYDVLTSLLKCMTVDRLPLYADRRPSSDDNYKNSESRAKYISMVDMMKGTYTNSCTNLMPAPVSRRASVQVPPEQLQGDVVTHDVEYDYRRMVYTYDTYIIMF